MTTWLHKKNLVVIGGTSGIGLSASKAFIREGARVVVVGRDEEKLANALIDLGENGAGITADARDPHTSQKAIALCESQFGGFDGLYHVAGGSGRRWGDGPLEDLTLDSWNHTLEWNLTSLMLSNQAAVKKLLQRGKGGSIVNMSSVLGYAPSPQFFGTHGYAAAKSAVLGFSKSVAAYYAGHNIRVNVIAPGLVETPMAQRAAQDESIQHFIHTKQPLDGGRIALAQDLDGLAVYLLSDYAKFTTGQVISVDGGWAISEGQL
ncbi:MAG: SDR family oxidoreductase [Bacteroidota bacterium]|nr:SDR family oxidoreductase [Bacteroidota bacterium]